MLFAIRLPFNSGNNNGSSGGDGSRRASGNKPVSTFFPSLDGRVQHVMRVGVPVAPTHIRVGEIVEMLRVSLHGGVPVGTPVSSSAVSLAGWVSEENMARAFLALPTDAERKALMESALWEVPHLLQMPTEAQCIGAGAKTSEAARQMDDAGINLLFVVDASGAFLGLVGRGDLVREMARPLQAPQMGGMATPLGVYLTTGAVSGGVGTFALMLTGLGMFCALLLSILLTQPLLHLVERFASAFVLEKNSGLITVFLSLLQTAIYLLFVRFSPLAGFHAAEHQTVHAVEKSYPLLPTYVAAMPRVHPRCGTNLVAGGLILTTTASLLQALSEMLRIGGEEIGYGIWAVAAFLAWGYFRPVGSFLQHFITTRPATPAQIQSGIRAAREVLVRHEARTRAFAPAPKPIVRLWHMGFMQIFSGFFFGVALLWALGFCFPALREATMPWLRELMG